MALFGRTKQQAQAAIARTKDRSGRKRVGSGSGVLNPPGFPTILTNPSITGTPTVGVPSSATAGTYSGAPTPTVVRSWLVNGVVVATASIYTPISGDAAKTLTVREVATNSVGSVTANSAGSVIAVSSMLGVDYRSIFVGDSQIFASTVPSPIFPITVLTGGLAYLPKNWNQGVSGNTTQDVLNRMAPILAAKADVIHMNIGTNDCGQTSDTALAINARADDIINQLLTNGAKYIILHTILPRFGAAALATDRENIRVAINAYRKTITDPRIKVVGQDSDWSSGDFDSGGLHQSYAGSWKFGGDFAAGVNAVTDPSAALPVFTDPSNMLLAARNPQLAGTSGAVSGTPTPTGTVPDTWTVNANTSGVSVVSSQVPNFHNGQIGERMVLSGIPVATNQQINFSNSVTATTAIGETYEAWAYFSLAVGASNMQSVQGSVATLGTTPGNTTSATMDGAPRSGMIRVPGYTLTNAPASIGVAFGMRTRGDGTVTCAADIVFSEPFVRKVTGANALNP